ncbi:MAG: nucleoside-diphosphate kinase [Planctomycetes bacterium]|nr:nucleoside-diphosphate kinase [Planctomycetota bacterium]
MSVTLSYLIITPYTLRKSRTGGVIARLLSRTDLELVGAQILMPDENFVNHYSAYLLNSVGKRDEVAAKLMHDYVRLTFTPNNGTGHRVMILLFRGENTAEKLFDVAGHIYPQSFHENDLITGETIRDTYSDLVYDKHGELVYFEPAVFTPPTYSPEMLEFLANYAREQNNIVHNPKANEKTERTLVIIKPDNWMRPSSRPGNVIDMLSRTGLRIVGCKLARLSVAEAMEFYGPVRDVLHSKLAPVFAEKMKGLIENEFDFTLSKNDQEILENSAAKSCADEQFKRIITFMSGRHPDKCCPESLVEPGTVSCLILIYEGENAISKIREVLGPTDPSKAPGGTVRSDYGSDVMVNTAHASDSVENAKREIGITKAESNKLSSIIDAFLKMHPAS